MKPFWISLALVGLLTNSVRADSPGFDGITGSSLAPESVPIPRQRPSRDAPVASAATDSSTLDDMPEPGRIDPGEPPSEADLMIRFNQKVVRSFTNHILTQDLDRGILHDVIFQMQDSQMRITVMANFDRLDQEIEDDLASYAQANYEERRASGETFLLVLDATMELSTMAGRTNTAFFSWDREAMNVYGVWADSREESALRDSLENEGVESGVSQRVDEIEDLQTRIEELESSNLNEQAELELLGLYRRLRNLQTLEIARVPVQLGEEPLQRVVACLSQRASTEGIAAAGLKIGHAYALNRHVLGFGGLNGLFQTHLPDFEIVHTNIEDEELVFAGRLSQ